MTESISDELRRTYELATMRHTAERLRTGRQWEQAREIMHGYDRARTDLQKAYEAEFPARMAEARQKLIHDAARRAPDLTHPDAGRDRSSGPSIEHKAKRLVRTEHNLDIATLDRAEARDLSQLMQRADRENRVQDKAKHSFERAARAKDTPQVNAPAQTRTKSHDRSR